MITLLSTSMLNFEDQLTYSFCTYSLRPGLGLYAHNLGEDNSTDIG